MIKELTDDQIIEGFIRKDSTITRDFFYGYCRIAYFLLNRRYNLANKWGMDFFSLAHEYYLTLDKYSWRQLKDRNEGVSLKTWMINGFRFIVLDKLKAVNKEFCKESIDERVEKNNLKFDVAYDTLNEDISKVLHEMCDNGYIHDFKTTTIIRMILIEGFKSKEVADQMGLTPSAITQRYKKTMRDVIIPYFKNDFETSIGEMKANPLSMETNDLSISTKGSSYDNSKDRITPNIINSLTENQIFVFGSNLAGMHGGGAALQALKRFGAVMGQGVGLQGQSYAIPTMQGGVDTIAPYVDKFIQYAKKHKEQQFLVTRIGCGIAGFDASDIAPLFKHARTVTNISLPQEFWDAID